MICCNKKTSGLTLVEILVVVVLISILAGIAVPSFERYEKQRKIKIALRDIHILLINARMAALKTNSYSVLIFSSTGCIAFLDNGEGSATAKDWQQQEDEKTIGEFSAPPNMTISNNFYLTHGKFRYLNRIGVTPGTIFLYYNEVAVGAVVINKTGRSRIEVY